MRQLAVLVLCLTAAGCGSTNEPDAPRGSLSTQTAAAADCLVPSSQLVNGGPGKDGIPALNRPQAVSAAEGDRFLAPGALVLGVSFGGQSRAYPHNVLWWHEIVNDEVGGRAIAASYCPLTGSGLVYDPVIEGRTLAFGVSGLLFDNNLVLFDRATDSLWSQMRVESICGSLAGRRPVLLPVVQSTWAAWKGLHPDTTVASFDTGFSRNYNQYPYGNYDQLGDTSLLFPQSFVDPRRPMKELVLGIRDGAVARAYPYGALGERPVVNDVVGARSIVVAFDRAAQMAVAFERDIAGQQLSFDAVDSGGALVRLRDRETGSDWDLTGAAVAGPLSGNRLTQVATYSAMWFAWAAFHRDTELFVP